MAVSAKRASESRPTETIARDVSTENTPDSPVVEALARQVANAFVLYANYKHYHWQTYGPLFRDLHKLFDEFAEAVLETVDLFAERVRMIGQNPPAHPMEVMEKATVAVPASNLTPRDMVVEANRNALIVIDEMRRGAKIAEEHGDPGTVDLFSRAVQIHEKQEWWLRDILRQPDGLCT
jgi:starvation-inducible DNA-binding protein